MEQPLHAIRANQTPALTPARIILLAASTALVFAFGWALSSGLASGLVEKVNEVIQVDVLKDKPEKKEPPPPPPETKAPPPPFVPPPDIVIQTDAPPPQNTITVQDKRPAPPAISTPASIGKPHFCGNEYPAISLRLGEQGTTLIGFTVLTDGHVEGVHVVNSSGSERLDNAAVSCAASWRYKPAVKEGQPVSVPWKTEVKWVIPK